MYKNMPELLEERENNGWKFQEEFKDTKEFPDFSTR